MVLNEIIAQYQNLILKVDSACHNLETIYQEHLVCGPGCSQCCQVERTVCSVEAYIVEQQLLTLPPEKIRQLKRLYKNNDETCPMLWRNRCVIYSVRPIICRTHGLPILYHEAERAFVDFCRLNFTRLPENYNFEDHQILDMNPINVELIEIDKKFSVYIVGKKWRSDNRRSLKSILFNLKI